MTEETKKRKTTKSQFQWKVLRFILIAYLVVFIISTMINSLLKEEKSIAAKIGNLEPYGISVKESLYVREYTISPYTALLKQGKTQEAYAMLTEEYQNFVPYEEYLKTIDGIDFKTFEMANIKMKTEGTYVAGVVYEKNGEKIETEYLLFENPYNEKSIKISPDRFIHSYQDLKFEEDNVELRLEVCAIYNNHITIKAILQNKSLFQDMTFNYVNVGYDKTTNKEESIDLILAPGEEKTLEFEYKTNYFVPNNIKIKRILDEDTLRTYTFYFEDSEK